MLNKEMILIFVSLVLLHAVPLAAVAGGAASVRLGPGSSVATGVSASSRNGGSRASVFVRVGNRWVPAPRGYYVLTPGYGTHPSTREDQLSGTDSTGTFYVNGYHVRPSGWLRVQVQPQDAEILVNGFAIPTDNGSGLSGSLGLVVGKHYVEVRKDGFPSYRTELEVQQASEMLLQVKLEK